MMDKGLKLLITYSLPMTAFFIALFILLRYTVPAYQDLEIMRKQQVKFDTILQEKEIELQKLKKNARRFETSAEFVEQLARQNKRVQKDEVIFVFDETPEAIDAH